MSQHNPPLQAKKVEQRELGLTKEPSGVEIRLELVTTCYRPDRTAPQIIALASELEQYVINGEPSKVR